MAKILCVLYDDPIGGMPASYPRDDLPQLGRYPDGQSLPTPTPSISSRANCSAACRASLAFANISKAMATHWS